MKVNFKQLHPLAQIPKRATMLAGGHDVTAVEVIKKNPNRVYCTFGFALQPPVGYKVNLAPRSSFTKYNWVMNNSPGLGDADYEGEYQVRFTAIPTGVRLKGQWKWPFLKLELTYDEFPYKVGDRVAQMYMSRVENTTFNETQVFAEIPFADSNVSRRGEGGFGSTGK